MKLEVRNVARQGSGYIFYFSSLGAFVTVFHNYDFIADPTISQHVRHVLNRGGPYIFYHSPFSVLVSLYFAVWCTILYLSCLNSINLCTSCVQCISKVCNMANPSRHSNEVTRSIQNLTLA